MKWFLLLLILPCVFAYSTIRMDVIANQQTTLTIDDTQYVTHVSFTPVRQYDRVKVSVEEYVTYETSPDARILQFFEITSDVYPVIVKVSIPRSLLTVDNITFYELNGTWREVEAKLESSDSRAYHFSVSTSGVFAVGDRIIQQEETKPVLANMPSKKPKTSTAKSFFLEYIIYGALILVVIYLFFSKRKKTPVVLIESVQKPLSEVVQDLLVQGKSPGYIMNKLLEEGKTVSQISQALAKNGVKI